MTPLVESHINVQRKANQQLIEENPVVITIKRTAFVQNASGGRDEQVSVLPPFRGRIVPAKQQVRKIADEAGIALTSAWLLIAPWNADIRASSETSDTFQTSGKEYRVTRVVPRKFAGLTYSIHAILEEVS